MDSELKSLMIRQRIFLVIRLGIRVGIRLGLYQFSRTTSSHTRHTNALLGQFELARASVRYEQLESERLRLEPLLCRRQYISRSSDLYTC